ncbi:2-C-methyl-D-erythritol 4-phosphate cytidylyltransferase, partial [Lachnotalea glycerini]
MKKDKCVAIVLAGGKGRRMESDIPKQYLELNGKPIIYYSINQFQNSDIIDEIVLVTGKDEIQFCKDRIVDRYSFQKVKHIIEGGKERYHSVYNSLQCINECDFVFIHDGARPFINLELINDLYKKVKENQARVEGVQTKDTKKKAE